MANVRSEYTVGLKDEVSGPLARMASGFDKFKVSIAAIGGIGAAGAIAAVTARIASAVAVADQLNRTSQKIGVTVEALSALEYAAKLADVSSETLSGSLGKLSKTMASAAAGGAADAAAFDAVSVAVKNADGTLRRTDDVLADIATAFGTLPDGATKTALAMRLFGRAGAELIPLLNDNADGFKSVTKEAQQFGVVISKDLAAQADALGDDFDRLRAASSALGISLASDVVPGLASLTTEFVKNYREASGLLKTFDALSATIAGLGRGSDQERLGSLLADQIGLEKEIRDLQAAFDKGDTGKLPFTVKMRGLRDELAAVKAESEGLKTVLDPAQQGLGRRTSTEPFGPPISDAQKRQNEARVRAALDGAEANKKEATEREKLVKAQDDYLAKLREAATIQGDVTELAKIEADIKFGAASKFSEETQNEARRLAGNVDLIKDTIEVQEYLNGLVKERAQLDEQGATAMIARREALIESLMTPLEKYVATIKELQDYGVTGDKLQIGIAKAREEMETAQTKASALQGAAKDLGLTFSSAFEDAIVGAQGFSEVLKGLAADIARILIRKSVTEPLANAFGWFLGGIGGGGSQNLGQSIADYGPKWGFGGGRASGGGVSRGKYYMVGENGPELFAPGMNGSIVPNGGVGGQTINIFNAPPDTTARPSADGRDLDIFVGGSMAKNAAVGRGGLRPLLATR